MLMILLCYLGVVLQIVNRSGSEGVFQTGVFPLQDPIPVSGLGFSSGDRPMIQNRTILGASVRVEAHRNCLYEKQSFQFHGDALFKEFVVPAKMATKQ